MVLSTRDASYKEGSWYNNSIKVYNVASREKTFVITTYEGFLGFVGVKKGDRSSLRDYRKVLLVNLVLEVEDEGLKYNRHDKRIIFLYFINRKLKDKRTRNKKKII